MAPRRPALYTCGMSDLAPASPRPPLLAGPPGPGTWLLRGGRAQGWALLVLTLFVLNAAAHAAAGFPADDFGALWSYGRMLHDHPAALLYDQDAMTAYHLQAGLAVKYPNPFPYPPIFMLIVWPLGLLSVGVGFYAWAALTVAAFVWAAGGWPRPLALLLLLAAPATVAGVVAGQNGFLTAALLVGGMRLIGPRPVLGGLLIALLAYKPQLGILVPVALAAAGNWRGIAATAAWLLTLVLLTSVLFGGHIWLDWLGTLPGYAASFAGRDALLRLQPTPLANLQQWGVPATPAHLVQAVLSLLMAALVWLTWRRGASLPAIGVLVAATFMATPHAFFYDMPMLTAAVLHLGMDRVRQGALGAGEALFLAAVLCVPEAMIWSEGAISLPPLLAFAAWAGWRAGPARADASGAGDHAPVANVSAASGAAGLPGV